MDCCSRGAVWWSDRQSPPLRPRRSRVAQIGTDPMLFLAGKTIVGGLIGGLIAVEFVKARLGIVVATGDLLVLPLAAGISIGRIGCFLTGLSDGTSGIATSLPWGVDFVDDIPRHPTESVPNRVRRASVIFVRSSRRACVSSAMR